MRSAAAHTAPTSALGLATCLAAAVPFLTCFHPPAGPSTNSFIGLWEALQNKQPQHPPAPAQQGALPLDEQTLQEVRREQLLQQYSGIGGAGQMAGGTLTLPAGFDPWGFSLQGFSLNLDGDFGVGPLAPPPPLPPQGSGGVSVAAAAPAPGALPSQLGQPPPPQVPAQQQAVQQAQQAHQHQQQQADARAMPPPEAQQAQQAHVYRPKPLVRPPSSTGLSGMAASDANNTRVAAPAGELPPLAVAAVRLAACCSWFWLPAWLDCACHFGDSAALGARLSFV